MRSRGVSVGLVAAAVVGVACHHAAPATAPVPAPPGEPPQVQAPVGAAAIGGPEVPASTGAPDPRLRRFEVVAVEDTTFVILVGPDHWVERGTLGVTVDPKRRDALVAKFRVLSRVGDSVTALVTGQTTRVSPTDVALIRQPVAGPLRQGTFWGGIFIGLAAGAGAALLIRH